jgi:hypothetical protein
MQQTNPARTIPNWHWLPGIVYRMEKSMGLKERLLVFRRFAALVGDDALGWRQSDSQAGQATRFFVHTQTAGLLFRWHDKTLRETSA